MPAMWNFDLKRSTPRPGKLLWPSLKTERFQKTPGYLNLPDGTSERNSEGDVQARGTVYIISGGIGRCKPKNSTGGARIFIRTTHSCKWGQFYSVTKFTNVEVNYPYSPKHPDPLTKYSFIHWHCRKSKSSVHSLVKSIHCQL